MRPDFETCKECASIWLVTTKEITAFPFDPRSIDYGQDILFFPMHEYCRKVGRNVEDFIQGRRFKDGVIYPHDGKILIYYNELHASRQRINWTIAHEIGHLVRGHKIDGDIEEVEAHFFAAQLYMPDDIILELHYLGVHICVGSLRAVFGVSKRAAEKKMEYLRKCWHRLRPSEYSSDMMEKYCEFIIQKSKASNLSYEFNIA